MNSSVSLAVPVNGKEAAVATTQPSVAVVIPAYRVASLITEVIARIPDEVRYIIVVDDASPDNLQEVLQEIFDPRLIVLRHDKNSGVGGAMKTGFKKALELDADIIVKIDGDGQMDPTLLLYFIAPILTNVADYTKGNRFYHPESLHSMPPARLVGNAILSFMTKLSSGYWHIFDPTNGYIAIHGAVLRQLPLEKIDERYFFESDMLFRLNTVRAVIVDLPMDAVYAHEKSNLSILRVWPAFLKGHARNTLKRIIYNYFLRDFHLASLEWIAGVLLIGFGIVFGVVEWTTSVRTGVHASAGTVMLSALPVILGLQLLLSALNYDVANVPHLPVHTYLQGSSTPPSLHTSSAVSNDAARAPQ